MIDQINEKILEWLSWRQLAKLMREEAPLFEMAPLRFSDGYADLLRRLADVAANVEREKLVEIRKDGLEIVGAKEERGETFVWWRKRQLSDMFRIDQKQLNAEAQKRLDELVAKHIHGSGPI